jgi:cytochrome c-type biogenesis protein CcmH
MALWIIFAVMTVAALLAVLWPLGRKQAAGAGGSEVLVYRDQLSEVDRDRNAGLIGQAEAEAARIEISRRLLAAADAQTTAARPTARAGQILRRRRGAAIAALIIVPLLPLAFYLALGSPDVPAQPIFARAKSPEGNASIETLVGRVEEHLAQNPNDGTGWEVIAPVYLRLGRFDDAVMARRKALALNGESATREADLGEALAAAANGVVTGEAKQTFEKAVALDPNEAKANYFLGLADEQDGNRDAAAKRWRAMIENAPAGAPWVDFIRTALGRVTGEPVPGASGVSARQPSAQGSNEPGPSEPGPSAQEMAAATTMSDEQRADMVRGMVAKLADRLHNDGSGDVDGWVRLVRAYVVLGDRDKAKDAVTDARHALASNPDGVKRIDDLVKGLGLEG